MPDLAPIDVLAVDDTPGNLLSLEAVLRDLGANLVKATSGDQALLAVLRHEPALILLDVQMPGLDGLETARLIRSRERSRHTPIVFLTAHGYDAAQVEEGYALGAVDFLFKPIVPEILRSKVAVFLDLHRKTQEVRRQGELLHEAAKREHERTLAEARARWEQEALRAEMARERKIAERLRLLSQSASALLLDELPWLRVGAILEDLGSHLGLEVHLLHLVEHDGEALRLVVHHGVPDPALPAIDRLQAGHGTQGRAARARRTVEAAEGEASAALRLAAELCQPLVANGRLLGVATFGSRSARRLDGEELATIRAVCDQLAMALDRSRLISELQVTAAELRAAAERKDEFLAMLAHELRNPLAPVVHALHLVRRRASEPDVLRYLDTADRQVGHMVRLIDDLLDVSRITRGKVDLRRAQVELAPVLEQALAAAEPTVRERRHLLEVSLPEGVWVDADPTRLAQVVANLLLNAAKYTEPGGRVRLSAAREGGDVVVAVRDSGIGLRPEDLERVFEAFVQIDPGSARACGGLGLGLSLVRRLCELHGGTVRAESEGPGKGSTFEVRLPIAIDPPARAAAPEAVSAPRAAAAAIRIALVEDNADIRDTLRDLLELQGHAVSEAPDGKSGVDLIVGARPALAFVDIGLPVLDGFEVAQRVRALAPETNVRLVALTGYGGADVNARIKDAGFDAHLVKPVDVDQLLRLIDELR